MKVTKEKTARDKKQKKVPIKSGRQPSAEQVKDFEFRLIPGKGMRMFVKHNNKLYTFAPEAEVNVRNTADTPYYVTEGDTFSVDAFGNKRVTLPGNRLDAEFLYSKMPDIFDENTSNGTVTLNGNPRDLSFAISSTTTGTYAQMASYPVPYTPGNSQLIEMTGVLNDSTVTGGTVEFFLRSNTTGGVTTETYAESTWFDTGDTFDWNDAQIFVMDFQSLRVGRIRYGFSRKGKAQKVGEITNDNLRNRGFWQSPNQPVYWRLYNTSSATIAELGYGDTLNAIGFRYRTTAVNAALKMKAICATVKSEGGVRLRDMQGFTRSADRGVTAKTVGATLVPILSIRVQSTFLSYPNKAIAIPGELDVVSDEGTRIVIIQNGTLSSASWTDVNTNESMMEYDVSATAVSGGVRVASGYIPAPSVQSAEKFNPDFGKVVLWDRASTSLTGIFTIAAQRTGTTSPDVLASISWEEIR